MFLRGSLWYECRPWLDELSEKLTWAALIGRSEQQTSFFWNKNRIICKMLCYVNLEYSETFQNGIWFLRMYFFHLLYAIRRLEISRFLWNENGRIPIIYGLFKSAVSSEIWLSKLKKLWGYTENSVKKSTLFIWWSSMYWDLRNHTKHDKRLNRHSLRQLFVLSTFLVSRYFEKNWIVTISEYLCYFVLWK